MTYRRTTTPRAILATLLVFASSSTAFAADADKPQTAAGPVAHSNPELTAPIERWDQAIPLGNGLTGGLLWGSGQNLKLSLDRGDLWDLRTPDTLLRDDWTWTTIRKLVAEKNQKRISELFDVPYNAFPYPTKIPAGRLELTLNESQAAESFRLDLASAVAHVKLSAGGVDVFYSAEEPVAMLRVAGPRPEWRIVAPDSLQKLGYGPPKTGGDGRTSWSVQEAVLGLSYAVVVGERRVGDTTEIALAITSTHDGPDPLALGRRRVKAALDAGYDSVLEPHVAWWRRFWSASSVRVPNPEVQKHYDLVQYFYGAASRRGAPPMPLQGVWTADQGTLPPWHGDYHHDLNTQLTYWAYLASGRFDQGAAFLDFMWDLLPSHRKFAQEFYGTTGAAVPGVMTLDGKAMGGWSQYSLSPTNGAWVAQAFYLHWRYTMDQRFLVDRAYPYCEAIGECLEELLESDANGKLRLPLSSSPEIHNNSLAAWLTPNSTNDLSILRWLFGALVEMARSLEDEPAVARWQEMLAGLDNLAVEGESGPLRLSPDESLAESHRHHSHLMPIHPLGILHAEGADRDLRIIDASLAEIDRLGTRAWCGYSFSWMSCIAARAGEPERAVKNLEIFLEAFISRNGFHVNGDHKRLGYSNFSYRPFTLEGNFAAGQAVHEMLLGSWGDVVRIFPAVPEKWSDVSFQDLRAEGGFVVSARREKGETVWVRIEATHDASLQLRDPFVGKPVSWNRTDVRKTGPDYRCTLAAGEALEGKL